MTESFSIPPEQHGQNAWELSRFREKIAAVKAAEQKTIHLRDVNTQDLSEEDAHIYGLFENDALDISVFETYRDKIQDDGSRADFAAYLANMIMIKDFKKYLSPKESPGREG